MRIAWNGTEWVLYGWQEWTNGESNWEPLARGSRTEIVTIMETYMENMERGR